MIAARTSPRLAPGPERPDGTQRTPGPTPAAGAAVIALLPGKALRASGPLPAASSAPQENSFVGHRAQGVRKGGPARRGSG